MENEIVLITIKTNIADYFPAIIKAIKTYYICVYLVTINIVESLIAIITNIAEFITSAIITTIKFVIVLIVLIFVYLIGSLINQQ
jgi:hypothetical protein